MALTLTYIIIMTWTKKHDEFCLEQKLRPSTMVLLRWILRRSNNSKVSEIEIDLKVFNAWVAKKRGRGYDRKTLSEAVAQLDEKTDGLILVLKNYTPWIKKLLVRPLDLVLSQRAARLGKSPKLNRGNPMYSEAFKKRNREQLLQNISKLDSFLNKFGLRYTPDALHRLWRFSGSKMSNIVASVELMLKTHGELVKRNFNGSTEDIQGIESPKGWLHECLKYGWHFDLESVDLPLFDSISALTGYVRDTFNSIGNSSPPQYQEVSNLE